jgi:hypothetical protein
MTLDEAIQHAEEQAYKLGNCECGKEHKQLAEWLKELKLRREIDHNIGQNINLNL